MNSASEPIGLQFMQVKTMSTLLDWSSGDSGGLYYRSTDCSGPALIADREAFGVVASIVLVVKGHAWLHMAEGTEGIGAVSFSSRQFGGDDCVPVSYKEYAWRSRPGIDLNTMFTPPFSIH